MAKACISCWTACLKDLQHMADAAGVADAEVLFVGEVVQNLSNHPTPLPHAAWKKLVQEVQVTTKLAALCVQALQQPDEYMLALTALKIWLDQAVATMRASPESHAAATVRQQLQESRLLQHLGPAMVAAAAQLTAAVAALQAAAATTSNSTSGSADAPISATTEQDSIQKQTSNVEVADRHCGLLLMAFEVTSAALSPGACFTPELAVAAAPAAMRLILTGFQACSKLQQLWQQKKAQLPLQVGKLGTILGSFIFSAGSLGLTMPGAVYDDTLQSSPAGRQLLLDPDFVSCLAIMLVVTVLGLDTSMRSAAGNGAAATAAASSSSSAPGVGSSTGSSSSSNGVRLDSLTPLSCGLFDILGVGKETVLQAAKVAKSAGLATLPKMCTLASCYHSVSWLQADHAKGAFNAQLLLQLETDLLLSLAVLQLTASIPDSWIGAQAARDVACQLCSCDPLYILWCSANLHQLPPPAAYTGPQLALQLLPSPFEPQQPRRQQSRHQQRRQHQLRQQPHQQQQQQLVDGCVLAPTAPLLAELLPLLARLGLAKLQQQQQQPTGTFARTVDSCFKGLLTLLNCSVVPGPGAAAAAAEGPPAATAVIDDLTTPYGCVLHALDAFLAHARDIISFMEAVLRREGALHDAVTTATAAAGGRATGGAASAGGAAAAAIEGASAGSIGSDKLQHLGDTLCMLCFHGYLPHNPGPLVLLALAAGPGSRVQQQLYSLLATMVKLGGLGKGPLGSKAALQYRAAAGYAASSLVAAAAAEGQQQQRTGAAAAAAAAPAGATTGSSGNAAAVAMLPSVVILGRCFLQWGEQMQAEAILLQEQQQPRSGQQQQHERNTASSQVVYLEEEDILKIDFATLAPVLEQWLASGSTCEQLTAAGYVLLPVQQQLEQLLPTCQILQDNSSDTAALLAAAQQLQSTGLALCSFAAPCMCNYHGCTNMTGLSELASVSGRSCICAGCRVARYCGRACQRAAWKQHKPVCTALSAAAAAGGTGADGT